jgi:hypothetical protein
VTTLDLLLRAIEGGATDDAIDRYFNTPLSLPETVFRAVSDVARDVLGVDYEVPNVEGERPGERRAIVDAILRRRSACGSE